MWLFDISNPVSKEQLKAVSILSLEEVNKIGKLPNEAILGVVNGESSAININNFRNNKAFIDFMHNIISVEALKDQSIHESAAQQNNGWLYIIDERMSLEFGGEISPEDIIGAFEVKDGKIVSNSYQPNASYSVFSENGFIQLPHSLHQSLINALEAL